MGRIINRPATWTDNQMIIFNQLLEAYAGYQALANVSTLLGDVSAPMLQLIADSKASITALVAQLKIP